MDNAQLIDELFDTIGHLNEINGKLWRALAMYASAEEYEELMQKFNGDKPNITNKGAAADE